MKQVSWLLFISILLFSTIPLIFSSLIENSQLVVLAATCYGYSSTDLANVCGGHGLCKATDTCECLDIYSTNSLRITGSVVLTQGNDLVSTNGRYKTSMQADGNLVIYDTQTSQAKWASGTVGSSQPYSLVLESNGALKIYGNGAVISTLASSCSATPATLVQQNDGNLVLYGPGHEVCWTPNTYDGGSNVYIWSGSTCSITTCYGTASNVASVCSGHGSCNYKDVCSCNSGYSGSQCQTYYCNGIVYNGASVCSGHGSCNSPDSCSCQSGYSGSNCETYYCNGTLYNSPEVCNSRGTCTATETCTCSTNYGGPQCQYPKCFGILQTMTGSVCSGHGTCNDVDTCACDSNWGGPSCSLPMCFGILQNKTSEVCSGHGICTDVDTCACDSNWGGLIVPSQNVLEFCRI
ncbi:hypothetical protein C9374_004466 [Naegleria lovaniensis]|uniref:Bulb-type lectin domain-containing protein n=1 Tax=Naegleria lovaniensis TaxID=51637 RepID=A0AA88GLG0_NAELO|nr:uncharacterized protein C9374_004466 [Naegleria lovaniensis]KAG2383129.1 hypothetical protein C9374_004466 [Naegleria lovaniensis]